MKSQSSSCLGLFQVVCVETSFVDVFQMFTTGCRALVQDK